MSETQKMNRTSFVDPKECTGCESCVADVPGVFRMTPDNLSEAYNPQGDTEEKILAAMDSCPVSCIHWKNNDS